MNFGYLVLGGVLLAIVVVDLLWTTLWVEGSAGPLTSRLMALSWKTLKKVAGSNPRLLTVSGPMILALSLSTWVLLLWAGWTFVFAGSQTAFVDTIDAGPISWSERFYFTGYTIFTLGNGDFAPRDGVWQIVTALTTATGMLFVTLSVTYILSVLDAVTQKRSFASGVSGLGARSEEFVQTGWDGDAFRGIDRPLHTFATQLNTLTSNHKAYPILHYFHSRSAEQAPPATIAVLDDAVTVLEFGVPDRAQPSEAVVRGARAGVDNYLETLSNAFIEPADRTPPPPDLELVRDAEIPTVSDDEFEVAVSALDERRRTLLGLVESDAREWPSEDDE